MIHYKHIDKIVSKLKHASELYAQWAQTEIYELPCTLFETKKHFTSPPDITYQPVSRGDFWGEEYGYGWFHADFTIPDSLQGQLLYLVQDTGAVECLVFLNGKPVGEFDYCKD